jgi:hypothetical protein
MYKLPPLHFYITALAAIEKSDDVVGVLYHGEDDMGSRKYMVYMLNPMHKSYPDLLALFNIDSIECLDESTASALVGNVVTYVLDELGCPQLEYTAIPTPIEAFEKW